MRTFSDFLSEKDDALFEAKLVEILTPIVEGRISFEQFVETVVVPTFNGEAFLESAGDVLSEFDWRSLNPFAKKQAPQPKYDDAGANNNYDQWQQANRGERPDLNNGKKMASPHDMASQHFASQTAAQHASKLDPINKQVSELINKNLIPVVQQISKQLKTSAYQSNNRMLSQAADAFEQRLTKAAQGLKFTMGGKATPEMQQQFRGDRNAHFGQQLGATPERIQAAKDAKAAMLARKSGMTPDGRVAFDSVDDQLQPVRPQQQPVSRGADPNAVQSALQADPRLNRRYQNRLRSGMGVTQPGTSRSATG